MKPTATYDPSVLKNLSLDNFKGFVVSGTTSSSADTKAMFEHPLKGVPRGYFQIEGDVYVPKGGFGASSVDVRSRLTSHPFSIMVFL